MSQIPPDNTLNSTKFLDDLLKNIEIFLKLRKKTNESSRGKNFTVFTALGNEYDEEHTHTRFIYEILRPDGYHGMGDIFLKEFFKTVLSDEQMSKVITIEREKTFQGGRIDLFIETTTAVYPIEVKIKATDQSRQIERYYSYARKKRKKILVFYLTIDCHAPSSQSKGNVPDDKIECISFKEEIRDWLIKCEDLARKSPSVAGAIRQYITLIGKLSECQEDVYMNAVQELISRSKESFLSAIEVEKNINDVRISKMREFMEDIKQHIENHELTKNLPTFHFLEEGRLEKFYKKNKWNYPKICFEIRKVNGYSVYLCIEIEDSVYYGVLFAHAPEWKWLPSEHEKVRDAFNNERWHNLIDNHSGNSWILWFNYFYVNGKLINFREQNYDGCYFDLYDEDKYQIIMNSIYEELDNNLPSILQSGLPKDEYEVAE